MLLAPSHQLGLDQAADLCKPLGVDVGGVGPVDHLERLVITGGGGELFKSCLGDEGNLDVGPCRKLNKSVAQVGLKTMQRAGLCFPSHEPPAADRWCSS